MANIMYTEFLQQLAMQTINVETDTIRVMLVTGYTPIAEHTDLTDVSSVEITGTNYVVGGAELGGKSILRDPVNNLVRFNANDVVWPDSTLTASGAIIYKVGGTPETSPLIAFMDFNGVKTSINGNFTIQWAEDGVFTLSQG